MIDYIHVHDEWQHENMSDGCLMSDGESSFTVGNDSKFRY